MTALEACESLRVLELGYNVFGAKGMQHLSDALRYGLQVRTSRPLLTAQQCAHCVTGGAQLIEFGALEGGPSMRLVPAWQVDTLKIGWCNIEDGDGAKALADLLMFNQTLATVDARGNKLVRISSPLWLWVQSTAVDVDI